MKNYMKYFALAAALATSGMIVTGCDDEKVNEYVQSAPIVTSFTPQSGCVGSEIVVTGQSLDDVVAAYIGGQQVEICQKVSNERLSIKVTANARSGQIVLANSLGEGTSEGSFTVEYPTPQISQSEIPTEGEMGNNLYIPGSHMDAVSAVIFTAEGSTEGKEAEIIQQNQNEIIVRIPFVEADRAALTFRYYDGREYVETPLSSAPMMTIARFAPAVDALDFGSYSVGQTVTLTGAYLNKIERVMLGDMECVIVSQSETKLQFAVPSSEKYTDGENVYPLSIVYFDGREAKTLTDHFVVEISATLFWKNVKIFAQDRVEGQFTSFFSPETGIAYANADWATVIDPIAAKYLDKTCSKNNVPAVSEDEYNSVNPYFFFSGSTKKLLSVNSPSNSKTQLRNFYGDTSSSSRITFGQSVDCYGTPVIGFVMLDPTNSSAAEIIDGLSSGSISDINESTFPIDVNATTCRGIKFNSPRWSPDNTIWAPDVFGETDKSANVDAYMLVIYFNVNGNGASNVKRIGVIHIKNVDFRFNSAGTSPSRSGIEFDMWWQKHDYDYSKL